MVRHWTMTAAAVCGLHASRIMSANCHTCCTRIQTPDMLTRQTTSHVDVPSRYLHCPASARLVTVYLLGGTNFGIYPHWPALEALEGLPCPAVPVYTDSLVRSW